MSERRPHGQSVTLDEETFLRLRDICERHQVHISGAVRIAVKALEDQHEPARRPRKDKTYEEVLMNAGVPREDLLLARNSVEHKLDCKGGNLPADKVLEEAFIWSETPQGHCYWAETQRVLYARGRVTADDIVAARKEAKR